MGPHLLRVVDAAVAGARRPFDGPAVLHIEHQGHLCLHIALGHGVDGLQPLAHRRHVPEDPGVAAAVVVHHSAVELLRAAPALAELEVLHRVGAVGHRLHGGGHVHPRLLQLGDRGPVGVAGSGLHQQEGLPLDGAHHIVPQGKVRGGLHVALVAPLGVGVPGDHVQLVLEFEVIVLIKIIHKVGGHRDGGVHRLHRVPLHLHKVDDLVGNEPLPVQGQAVDAGLPLGHWGVDLFPVGVGVAPEGGPPLVVQVVQGAVLLPQPPAEGRLALGAVALAAVLVGQVPQNHPGMAGKPLGQGGVHGLHLLPVEGGGVAVVVAAAGLIPHQVGLHPADLRVLFAHPHGLGARGRGQHGVDAVFIQIVNDLFQPVKVVHALLGLQLGPGENAHGHAVDVGLFHQADILLQDVGAVQPLVRVVVPAVEHVGVFGGQ